MKAQSQQGLFFIIISEILVSGRLVVLQQAGQMRESWLDKMAKLQK